MVDVHVVTSLDQLGEHAEAWDRLAMASADRLPMLSHAWVSSFLEHRTVDGSPWQCFFAYDGAELVGVLPLVGARAGVLPRMQGPADSHTASAYPLLAADAAPSTLVALVDAASAQAPRLRMRWYRVRETSPVSGLTPCSRAAEEGAESAQQPGVAGADDRHAPGLRGHAARQLPPQPPQGGEPRGP